MDCRANVLSSKMASAFMHLRWNVSVANNKIHDQIYLASLNIQDCAKIVFAPHIILAEMTNLPSFLVQNNLVTGTVVRPPVIGSPFGSENQL